MTPKAATGRGGQVAARMKPAQKQTQKQTQRQKPPQDTRLEGSYSASASQHDSHHAVAREIQQSILNVFTQAFPVISHAVDFKRIMQEVKGHLYDRDFKAAFGKPEYLEVYASRWSAARALAYADIFTRPDRRLWYRQSQQVVEGNHPQSSSSNGQAENESSSPETSTPTINGSTACVKVVCIGGGAGAEIVALATTSRYIHSNSRKTESSESKPSDIASSSIHVLALDIADWSEPVRKIASSLTQPPRLPEYVSQACSDANRALVEPELDGYVVPAFKQEDVLLASLDSWRNVLQGVALITIMFTLNELFSTSLPKTTALLLNLTEAADVGTHLVVVDSPGSYSEIQMGKTSVSQNSPNTKQYPMKWLLDHTLLDVAGKDERARWSKVEEDDSKWFRIDQKLDLKYGIELENCRYQIHVFRKLR